MTDKNRSHIRQEVQNLVAGGYAGEGRANVTSDLSIDEALILHSIGWEPVELVCGAGVWPIPVYNWNWGNIGEVTEASVAWLRAFEDAEKALRSECSGVGGHGVVGVSIEVAIEHHFVKAVFVGTAVAPVGAGRPRGDPFASDLSCRDFALLHQYGWDPVGLVAGASFVAVPRRTAMTAIRQSAQNVELANYTDALYSARESAMEKMQHWARGQAARGVVAVQLSEGPLHFARHVVGLTVWGTGVRPSGRGSVLPPPQVVIAVDDASFGFEAASLRD
jgi:uncharacterized protein YbjQ (UPF0145 family)